MLTFALETVTRRGSVATCVDGRSEGQSGDAARPHGERLPGDVMDWLAAHGFTPRDVDLFAVVSGPGSFTGLRIGIAAIQGFALAGGRQVIGIPTLDAMVAAVSPTHASAGTVVVPCLDGQRGEVFAAAVDTLGAASPDAWARLLEPMSIRPGALADLLHREFGGRTLVIVGHDVERYADALVNGLGQAELVSLPISLAESAARLAAADPGRAAAPHALRPLYVRRPDAEITRERQAAERRSSYRIRRATGQDDLAAVDGLQRQTFTNPWGAEAIRWELENTDVSRLYLMHDAAGTLVAYCACWMVFDELHINSLAVDLGRRREGLATRLLRHVLAEAAATGAAAATLEVRRSNTAARALYEGLGFHVEGLRRDYYQDPREDAVILWNRALGAGHGEGQRAEGKGQREG